MQLHELVTHLPAQHLSGPPDQAISGLAYDSRQVQPGGLFVAIKGYHVDGHAYIPQALARGAVALVVDARHWSPADAPELPASVTLLAVPDSRLALAPLAAALYGYPSQRLGLVGVTGTKGKTTASTLMSRALESGDYRTGLINSVDFKVGAREWPNSTRQSTPEAPEVQALLRDMVSAGCDYAVIEATSHALSARWDRVRGCVFDVAVLTNITHEHLDFHGTFEHYRSDKARLFAFLDGQAAGWGALPASEQPAAKQQKYAIVNADDPNHSFFLEAAPAAVHRLTFALDNTADVRGHDLQSTPQGTRLHVATPWGSAPLHVALPGTFNVLNALAALSVALTQGVPLEQATTALGTITGVRGRMQRIERGQPFGVIIDYAHNPDSFAQVMGMLRPLVRGRIIAVFGSAGERDRAKRPQQGAIAARYCDLLVLTDEDPRREDREQIIAEIAAGAAQQGKRAGVDYLTIPDRPAAIQEACERATAGDLVLLLGKGHESSIEYPEGKRPWDEVAQAHAALAALGWHGA
jgi:UDP-N-acetylmuramoyl-L-alanyl-D-glutamate--2,6-diaminopimelate ligase